MQTDITLTGGAGEYMESATVVSWTVKPGTAVRKGDVLAVVETAKAATEIEAPCDGVLSEILAEAGTEVEIGRPLGRIGPSGSDVPLEAKTPVRHPGGSVIESGLRNHPAPLPAVAPALVRLLASPLARRLAADHGLPLAGITGTGPEACIKQRDVEKALLLREAAKPAELIAEARPLAAPSTVASMPTTPIVMIHGYGASSASWNPILPLLTAHPCLAINLPAHGPQQRTANDLAGLVLSAVQDLESAGYERINLVGHSLGGAVTVELAASGTFCVDSLTLLAPMGLGPDINGSFLDGFGRADQAGSLRAWLDLLVHDPAVLSQSYAAAILRERERFGLASPQRKLAERMFPNGTQTGSVRSALERSACPTKIIWGASDVIIRPDHARNLPGAVALHLLRDVGHLPHVEAPGLVSRLILENVRSGMCFS